MNVFVTANRILKLGDFGIAKHRVGNGAVRADAFHMFFGPTAVLLGGDNNQWKPADDVYQLGQLFGMLLRGKAVKLSARSVKALPCTVRTKAVIQRCIGLRRKRFATAREMLEALASSDELARFARVRSLVGKRIVFTGRLKSGTRSETQKLVEKAGGIVDRRINSKTDVVVVGQQSKVWKADGKGQKLLDVDHEAARGHRIARITEGRLLALLPR
jgi:serine/threonine-protein kinase